MSNTVSDLIQFFDWSYALDYEFYGIEKTEITHFESDVKWSHNRIVIWLVTGQIFSVIKTRHEAGEYVELYQLNKVDSPVSYMDEPVYYSVAELFDLFLTCSARS